MALAQLKFWWGILETLEKAGRNNSTLRDRYAFFNFTMQQWVREQLIRLSEVDFTHTPARVQRAVQLKWEIYKSTLPCELAGGRLRRRQDSVQGKRLGATEKHHQLLACSVLDNFDTAKTLSISKEALIAKPPNLSKTLYQAKDWDNSLGLAYDALSGPSDWLNLSPEHRRLCYFAFRAFSESNGVWELFTRTWPSAMAVRKCYISKEGDGCINAGYGRSHGLFRLP